MTFDNMVLRASLRRCFFYTDEGITGTNTKHREGFKRMVADALAGKIDLIVTKSVSRFARNTVDSLTTVRQLKEKGVEIYFEKENIWTLDSKGELLITIMSSLAQEESRSISENCTWGQRKRFADGKVTVPFKRFLGYDRGPDGNLVLNKDEAVIIRRMRYGTSRWWLMTLSFPIQSSVGMVEAPLCGICYFDYTRFLTKRQGKHDKKEWLTAQFIKNPLARAEIHLCYAPGGSTVLQCGSDYRYPQTHGEQFSTSPDCMRNTD